MDHRSHTLLPDPLLKHPPMPNFPLTQNPRAENSTLLWGNLIILKCCFETLIFECMSGVNNGSCSNFWPFCKCTTLVQNLTSNLKIEPLDMSTYFIHIFRVIWGRSRYITSSCTFMYTPMLLLHFFPFSESGILLNIIFSPIEEK